MEFIISGLILGLITSFHCVGMCGPIAIALPLHGSTKLQKLLGGILYNLGRTVTYMIMGMVFGLIGQGLGALGFQRWVSIITGVLMISTVFFPSIFKFSLGGVEKKGFSLINAVKKGLRRLFSTKSYLSLFTIGLLNGLLPCGPLYSALIISTGTGHAVSSVLFMMMFGLGTIPLLLVVTIIGNFVSGAIRNKVNKALPVVIVIIGILFILRGLELGIPYLSPTREKIEMKMNKTKKQQEGQTAEYSNHDSIPETRGCCGR
ncbi:MAG: sulfite exporter TauE/SafE family protein [Bacteroidales bacterium]|nr:sulfite exporter TauE/SafE family protein [Bacteroidales bacterium]